MQKTKEDVKFEQNLRLEVLKLAVSHVVNHPTSIVASPNHHVELTFDRFMELVTCEPKENPSA